MSLATLEDFVNDFKSLENTISAAASASGLSATGLITQFQSLEQTIGNLAKNGLINSAPQLEAAATPIVTATIALLTAKLPAPLAAFFQGLALNAVQDMFEVWFPATASQTTIAVAAKAAAPNLVAAPPLLASATPAAAV